MLYLQILVISYIHFKTLMDHNNLISVLAAAVIVGEYKNHFRTAPGINKATRAVH